MAEADKARGAGYEMTLVRIFRAPPALVFDCFIDPVKLARWWGPLGCENEILKLEVQPGGEISLHMAGPGYSHTMGGEYVEIDPPRRLVFRTKAFEAPSGGWGIINRNTLTFEDLGGATRLTLHTLVEKAEGDLVLGALGGMKAGWGQSIERLGDLVGGGGKMDIEVTERRILLARAFDAPREAVWRALTEPEAFARWWCDGGCLVETMDVRPGGAWRVRKTSPDGAEHLSRGEYAQVEPSERLVMTQAFDARPPIEVAHALVEEWGRTTLIRTLSFPDNASRDGMLEAGTEEAEASYDRLAALLATS